MQVNFRLALACTLFAMVGCSQEAVQTVDWYTAHEAARKATIDKCNGNPGESAKSANCINAAAAHNALKYKVPPPSDRSSDKGF